MGEILPYIPFLPASSSSARHHPRTNFYLHLQRRVTSIRGLPEWWGLEAMGQCIQQLYARPHLPGGVRRVPLPGGQSLLCLGWGAVRRFKGGARRQRDPPTGHVEVLS